MRVFIVLTILTLLHSQANSQIPGCLLAVPGTLQCQICSSNLELDDLGNCKLYTPIEGCNVYNSSTNGAQCSTCSQGYLLSNGICLQMIPNCASTSNVNTCDQCASGFTLARYSNCFSTNVSNCPSGTLPRSVSGVSFCQQFNVLNCAALSSDGLSCSNCSQGYTSINGICFLVQNTVPCMSNSCNCQGYYFSNNCYNIQLSNCLQSADKAYCDLCNDLYYSSSGACSKFIKNSDINCNVLASDGITCAGCILNYFLNADFICTKNYQLCPTPCTACPWDGFTLYKGNCYYEDPLCLVYNFTQQMCSLCVEGYTIDPITLNCIKAITCLSRDANNFCNKCFTGYQLDYSSYQCVQLPNNCAFMNTSSLVCLNCSQGTTFSNNICVFSTANCLNYDIFGYCQTCVAGFVKKSPVCVPVSDQCKEYVSGDQSLCSVCLDGYRISGQQCYLIIEGCLVYSNQNSCVSCRTGYLLANGNCFSNDPNCVSQDSNGLCQQCLNGFLPYKSKCVYYDPYCLAYDPTTTACLNSSSAFTIGAYSLQQQLSYLNFVMQVASFSQNPANSDFNGASGQGSYTKDGKIVSLPFAGLSSSSIASYDLNGNILTCQKGFTLVKTQCVIATQNCMAYNQMNICQQCNPGFDLVADGSCSTRSSTSCAQQSGGICLQAASGYSLIGGSAYFAGNNINKIGANGQIIAANSGYFVWAANNIAWPYDFNCIQQNQPGKCLQCSSSQYALVNGKCVLSKTNCLAYSVYGLCMGCQAGFMLWAGECRKASCSSYDVTGYCKGCQANYALSLGFCAPNQINYCQLYNGSTCSFCQAGYYLTNGALCAKMINFCQTASAQTGRCSQCAYGYTIYQEQCIPQISNCQAYAANLTSCSTCNTLYYPILNSTVCLYLGYYCAAMNDSSQCTTCNPGLTLMVQNGSNICIRPIPNCFWYDPTIKCTKCNNGYVLQYNKCKSLRCGNYNYTVSQCIGCLSPFVLSNGSCIDPNCDKSILEKCLNCLPRYYLSGTTCILSPDPNCLNYSSAGYCLNCLANYTINEKGICASNDILFYGCSTPAFPCPQCAVGYILNGSLCYARRCSAYKSNRDCLSCINYYIFETTQRFGIIYTCASPSCYTSDAAPAGFYVAGNGSLQISNCISYNGASCAQCDDYRYPNPSILYNLCYPYNCQVQNLLNCAANCLANFAPTASSPYSCLATNCLSWDSTGKCLQCTSKYQLTNNSYCLLIQIPFCLVINYTAISCSICQTGFDLYNGYCRASNCMAWVFSNNSLCSKCVNGYLLDSNSICNVGKCSQVSSANQSQCLKCLLGYSLQGAICYANNCKNYDWSTLTCLACQQGYDVVNGIGICKASNCNSYDSNLVCTSCINTTNSVYALRSGICVSVDANCISFDASGNCLACNNPAIYANVADICVLVIQGCLSYSKLGCISCAPAFTLSNGICEVLYCNTYATPYKCSACQSRYQLQSDFTCYPKNCINFNNQTWQCVNCQPRFQLVNSQFCFTYNCTNYSVQNYVCTKCAPGFTLSAEACLYSNCPIPNQFNCASCVTGFQLISGVCQAPKNNCTQYDPNNFVCLKCAQGFNLTALGICVLVQLPDPYCISYDPQSGNCTKCLPNFNYNAQAQQCESSFCSQFNTTQLIRGRVCTGCFSGFALDSSGRYCISIYCQAYSLGPGTCTNCSAGTTLTNNICYASNCFNYSIQYPLSPICLTCNSGYTLLNFVCKANNCQSFNADYSCQLCASGYALNSGICISTQCNSGFVFQNFNCVPANCLNYSSSICYECLPGFVQERGSCLADSCLVYNNQYLCQQCRQGYNLTLVNGQYLCIIINIPVCPQGYYLSSNSCISIPITNCSTVDASGANCYHCIDGFFLKNGICYSTSGCTDLSYITGCYACAKGYYLQGSLCIFLNCLTVYPNNTCINCISGYNLVNGACRASIYKCQQTDSQGNCVQCLANFQLTQGYCIAIGCSTYSPSSYMCLTCASNYILNGEICQLKITIPNCYQAVNATYCSQCSNGYVQLNGICYAQIQYCVSYNPSNGGCSICTSGYYLTNTNICSILPQNCLTANSNGICTNCAAGYIAASGQCVAGTAYCQSFDPNTALCLQCIQGYYLTANNRCFSLPQFCLAADRAGACTSCKSGYSISGGICVVTISNCLIYNQNNPAYCYQCSQGYYLNVVYGCTILPPFCLSANNLGYCLNCQQGYSLFNNGGLCVIFIPNCISYVQAGSNSTHCVQCATGYTLTNNYSCSSLPPNCLSINNAGACIQCATGYQLYSNLCVIGVVNCIAYNSTTFFCSSCANGYYLFQSNGAYLCQALPSFCLAADFNGNCQSCFANYIIYNGICVLGTSILNCLSYNLQTYTCLSCVQGYYLNNNNICTLLPNKCASASQMGTCLGCIQGYQLSGNICVIYVVNCTTYNYATGSCTQCAQGYTLSQDQTTCNLIVTNCQIFNPNGLCLQCLSGYFLLNGYCIALPQGCSQLNNQQICIGCSSQYTLVQNVCVLTIANCAYYNITGCYQCNPFYYYYNYACQSFPANCLSFDTGILHCISCATGYTLNRNTYVCSKAITIANCATYNSNGQCLCCFSRYYLKQNSCYQYPAYCVNVDLLGNCLSCAFGSTLQNGNCIATSQRSLNCLTFNSNSNICLVCMSGYNLCTVSGVCILPDPGCATFANDGNCQQCKSSYQLFQGRCLQYPTGVIIVPNGGLSCASGYTFQNNTCYRVSTQLGKLSDNSYSTIFSFSSNGINSVPSVGSNTYWSPSNHQLNEYLSIQLSNGNPQIVFQVGIQGNSQGWVSSYIIQFKNNPTAPFICWNSCNQIQGNTDGHSLSLLQLNYPIIASELRIYPVRWVNQINLQVQLWIESYQ